MTGDQLIWLIPTAIVLAIIVMRSATAAPAWHQAPADLAGGGSGGGPGLDVIGDIARAFAHAEGFGRPDVIPTIRNNPGDMRGQSGEITTYGNLDDGWAALRHQITLILNGGSHVYRPTMPIIQIAALYTSGNSDARSADILGWATTVANDLGLSINDPLTSYIPGAAL